MKYKSILVMGNVASGKSTLTHELSKKLHATEIKADELYKINPFFKESLKDRRRWSFVSDIWFLTKRVLLYKHALKVLKHKNIVIDSGLPMSLVYAHSRLRAGFFTKSEWFLYKTVFEKLTEDLPLPNYHIFLQTSVTKSLARISKRGRIFEVENYTAEYLETLESSLEYVKRYLEDKGVCIVDVEV